eukprot:15485503-Alexandrium_andersonii.AAC.1
MAAAAAESAKRASPAPAVAEKKQKLAADKAPEPTDTLKGFSPERLFEVTDCGGEGDCAYC